MGYALCLAAVAGGVGLASEAGFPRGTRFYSTAEAPLDYRGPRPSLLALDVAPSAAPEFRGALDRSAMPAAADASASERPPAPPARAADEVPRLAKATTGARTVSLAPSPAPAPRPAPSVAAPDPIATAQQAIAACQARYAQVRDYTCTFHKRERINGRLNAPHTMLMKARTNPTSIYFKFVRPNKGREAIYVAGRNGGRIIAHDVGIGKLVAGTMHLDPRGSMAMEDNRHPVTEAGIGALIETVANRWARELTPEDSRLTFHPKVMVGNRACTMIESMHPRKQPGFLFHNVKLYIDQENGLPIRFEGYDWPRHAGAQPELVEEYTYMNLRLNVGLRDQDFDPAHPQYSFGRF